MGKVASLLKNTFSVLFLLDHIKEDITEMKERQKQMEQELADIHDKLLIVCAHYRER